MDQKEFEELTKFAPKPASIAPQLETTPGAERQLDGLPELAPEADVSSLRDQAWAPRFPETFEAFATGVAKAAFETGDFLFGDTPEGDQTSFRQAIEARDSELKSASILSGFSSGVGQFAGAMVGLGKVAAVTKLVPWFGKGLGAVSAALPKTAEVGKAALAGAVAFDPHEERLSNLVQDTPLANPVTAWLAADPTDSAAEGRIKSALESIGLDVAIIGTFLGSTKVWKSLRQGDAEGASRAVDQMQAEQARHIAESEGAAPERSTMREGEGVQTITDPTTPQSPTEGATATVGVEGSAVRQTPQASPAASLESANGISTQPLIRVTEEDTAAVLRGMAEDAEAIEKAGGWYQAIQAGHTFGRGEGIPYAKLNADRDVDDFMARVVDATEEQLDALKGGAVLEDTRVTDTVSRMANLFDTDPAQALGSIQQAGAGAANMVAQMEAGYLVANRMFQDSYALATRIRLGDFSEFGSHEAALSELKRRIALASSVYGSARSITAASGRALRRMRFQIDPEAFNALKDADGERMVDLLAGTEGNPRAIARLVREPSLWSKVSDWGQFLLVNNLVSGPKTQLINLLSNSYMVGARPLERLLGSAYGAAQGSAVDQRIFKEALRQYTYLGTAFTEGFGFARKAFMQGDSIVSPHFAEAYEGNQAVGRALGGWKPWHNPGNILHNALKAAAVGIGMPTRSLGFVDEAVKQTVYRSKVMATAHVAAVEEGIASGLTGDALRQHVRLAVARRVEAAFDAKGRGTDPDALREARTATFQQELLPHTFGKWVNEGASRFFPLRMVLPFVKTPTNVIRYGWKMTPGLNMLQTEYRDMLKGRMGPAMQAQATGQMMLGGLFMGSAAVLVSQGTITGGGPKDPHQRAALLATGWQPYSAVVENADGSKTFIPFGRLDPVAIPFGIIADLQDALHALGGEEPPEFGAAVGALLVAISRQFRDKTYLSGVNQALDALSDPEARRAGSFAGQTVTNFVPLASALRQLNPDPHLRDARDMADKLLATIPGLSDTVRARYDAWGDPVITRKGLWSSDEDQLVDREVQRLVLESGATIVPPNPKPNGVDLRELTMEDGRNAWVVYQELAGHPPHGRSLKDVVARRMQTRAYQLAPDGDIGTKGTKLWLLHEPVSAYRERAMKRLKRDRNVRDAFRADDLKARDQYRANKAANPAAPAKKLGDSFGVDLRALDTNR